jgi:hypothetical protein
VIDVVSHEHDIRGGVGRPGDRDSDAVHSSARTLVRSLEPPAPVVVRVDGDEVRVGPEEGEPLVLTTTPFEALRFRMGRRSPAQMASMEWSGDPSAVLGHLVVFGPAGTDVIE